MRLVQAAAGLLALLACGAPATPAPADGSVRVLAAPVPLNPGDPRQARVGQLTYAGGVALTSPDTSRFHGLSGLDVAEDGRGFIAVTDDGDLVRGRLRLDRAGRLSGVEAVKLTTLAGEGGRPLQGKEEGDAEAVTWLTEGRFAVAFERQHRVIAYGAGRPRLLFRPNGALQASMGLRENAGPEALALAGGELIVGSESGRAWAIRQGALGSEQAPPPSAGYSLTGLDALDGPDLIAVYRAWDPFRGSRAVIAALPAPRCIRAPCDAPRGFVELARLAPPLTADNFEAVAAVPRSQGGWRLYLLSDDNFSARQRTLLLAFDWAP